MASTFNDEYKKALGERGLALVSKGFAVKMKLDATVRRDDLEKILFGAGADYGIVSVLSLYYNQIWLAVGKKTSKPLLYNAATAKSQYQSQFTQSVTLAGDGAGGLYPPQEDNPSAGQDDLNITSPWLTNHALDTDPTGSGILQSFPALINAIGKIATANGNGRGPYISQAAAQAQANIDRGSGYLGLRTENSEIYSTGTSTVQWWIGQDGIDTPDNFTFKGPFIQTLTNLRNSLNSLISVFQSTLAMLDGANGAILSEYKIDLPVSDKPALTAVIKQFQGFASTIQGHIDYFNGFTDPSSPEDRTAINNRMIGIINYTQTLSDGLNARANDIPSLFGTASTGLNKYLVHWVGDVVKKPDGPYAMLLSAQNMLATAEANIKKKNDDLNFFETNRNRWMESTEIQAIYNRAVLNVDQSVNRWEVDNLWNLIQSANKYKVLSQTLSSLPRPLTNAAWNDSAGIWIVNKLDSGFLNNIQTITPPPKETMVFRIISYDTSEGPAGDFARTDAFNTKSDQTDIISGNLPFTPMPKVTVDDIDRSVVSFSGDALKLVKERSFLWLNESTLAQVLSISDTNFMLDMDYGTISSIHLLFGVYYVG